MARNLLAIFFLLGIIALLSTTAGMAASIGGTSDFQDGSVQGWSNSNRADLITVQSGGQNGPDDQFLVVEATGGSGSGSKLALFNDDDLWTGDFSAATSLNLDMMNPTASSELEMRLVLFGPNNTSSRWTSDVAITVPNDGEWRSYSFPIDEEAIVPVRGGATFEEVSNGVIRTMLRHDSGSPSAGGTVVAASLAIDNIILRGALRGDFDQNNVVDVADVDLLLMEVGAGTNSTDFDLDSNGTVNRDDIRVMLNAADILNSYVGDANLDGQFDSGDLVLVLQTGVYEDNLPMNASWESGDWNGDGDFDSGDLVFALQEGGYERGMRPAVAVVPEPSSLILLALGILLATGARSRRDLRGCTLGS
ncbi:MAG: hypothetical protein CMJ77_04985 [Planctomycetaceae bacterium]|nr:hypothetical protein [Planctomycetaceae bacterium]